MVTEADGNTDEVLAKKEAEEKAEYDKAFAELEKEESGLPENNQAPDKDPEPEPEPTPAPEPDPEARSATHGDIQSMEKSVADSRSHAMRLQNELTEANRLNSELASKVSQFNDGKVSQADLDAAKEKAAKANADVIDTGAAYEEKVNAALIDYPELKSVLDPIKTVIAQTEKISNELETMKQERVKETEQRKTDDEHRKVEDERKIALDNYNTHIKPKVLEKHPDYDSIMFVNGDRSQGMNMLYFEWAEKQSPALRTAAVGSDHPDDIIHGITEYKKYLGSDDAAAAKAKEDKEKQDRINNAQTLRGGASGSPTDFKTKGDKGDFDAGWADAEAANKKDGLE